MKENEKLIKDLNELVSKADKVVYNYFDKEDVGDNEIFNDMFSLKSEVKKLKGKYVWIENPKKCTCDKPEKLIYTPLFPLDENGDFNQKKMTIYTCCGSFLK